MPGAGCLQHAGAAEGAGNPNWAHAGRNCFHRACPPSVSNCASLSYCAAVYLTNGECNPPPPGATPVPTSIPITLSCTNRAAFVKDLTIPDGSLFAPGASFAKTWRLKNSGTCTWKSGYQVVFINGQQMGGASPMSLQQTVPPGKTIDLSITLTAPASEGYYAGAWQLRSPQGLDFGIGQSRSTDQSFWVKIHVSQAAGELKLGAPLWQETFKNAANWYLVETDNTHFSVKKGHMVMEVTNPAREEEWGLAIHSPLADFYIEAAFTTGSACSGKDRYGLLLRAPKPNTGYVFDFSCDGRYRFYKWDGNEYAALVDWTTNGNIKVGPNQANRMGFRVEGEALKLYANGKLLAEFSDDSYAKGRFGLVVGSAETQNLVVYVNEVALWSVGK